MPLAAILVLSALLMPGARAPSAAILQAAQSQPEAQPSNPPSAQPEPPAPQQAKPDAAAPQEAKPEQPAAPQPAPPDSTQPQQATPPPASPSTAKPTPAKKSAKSKKKPKPAPQPGDSPSKVVVRNGSTADAELQLSPGLTQAQASQQVQSTTQLLNSTEANLKQLSSHTLKATEQDTVNQIRTYMTQAKAALEAQDPQRAHNLAFKAHLLSAELLRH